MYCVSVVGSTAIKTELAANRFTFRQFSSDMAFVHTYVKWQSADTYNSQLKRTTHTHTRSYTLLTMAQNIA